MPISNFSQGLQDVISFLPGTYGTCLLRNHALRGVFEEMESTGFPKEVVESIKDSVDCNIYFFDDKVAYGNMYMILIITIIVALGIYVLLNVIRGRKQG